MVAPFYLADDALPVADDARAQLKDDAAQVLDAALGALEPVDAVASRRPSRPRCGPRSSTGWA